MKTILRTVYDKLNAGVLKLPLPTVLKVLPGQAGFFGEVFVAINGLRLAELNKRPAVIFWDSRSLYHDSKKGPNAWTYFFQQSQFNFLGDQFKGGLVISYKPGATEFTPYRGLSARLSISKALHTWCKPCVDIENEVELFSKKHFENKRILGVHVRLTDVAAGAEGRRSVDIAHIVKAVDDWLHQNPYGEVYLATDDQRIVEDFLRRYFGRIIARDCIRSHDGTSIHGHYDKGVEGDPYLKGRDVLIDALLLSRCSHLIRTHSRVTAFSLCWNPSLSYSDLEREILGVDRTPWLHQV